jgi:predicted CopG family antitoxin
LTAIGKSSRGKKLSNSNLICVFVFFKPDGYDELFILTVKDLQEHFLKNYKGGVRPRNPKSTHCAIWPQELMKYRDNRELITIDEEVYEGLYKTIGPRKISKFVEELVRPHVVRPNLELAYSQMAKDKKREAEALDWAEATFKDIVHEKR